MSDDGRVEVYQIKVRGQLDPRWSDWLGGMGITCQTGADGLPVTLITGGVPDQAALRGIVCKLWDLNLRLISVVAAEPNDMSNPG
jgi:hypothetical protein